MSGFMAAYSPPMDATSKSALRRCSKVRPWRKSDPPALRPKIAYATTLRREIFEAVQTIEVVDLEMGHSLWIRESHVDGHPAAAIGF